MRGLTDVERDVMANSLSVESCSGNHNRGVWNDVSQDHGLAANALIKRGLAVIAMTSCGSHHLHPTAEGRLAYKLDTAARNLEANKDFAA